MENGQVKTQRKLHVSWHIAAVSVGVLTGIALAAGWNLALATGLVWLTVTSALLAVAFIRRTYTAIILSVAAGLMIGMWRGSSEQSALQSYQPYYGQTTTVRGRVLEDTAYGKQGDLRLRIGAVSINGKKLPGEVWVSTAAHKNLGAVKRSDIVYVNGKIGEGFGNLPASMFRSQLIRVERPVPGDVALHVRDWFAGGIRQAIPEPEASLGSGYLIGQRSTLPAELDEQLKIAGLTHIVVASGYNLTILVGFARRSLLKTSKYLATLASVLLVCGFVMVTGLSPSMTRAGLVTLMGLAAWYYGRRVHPLVLLPFAAAITAVVNPAYVWGDIGWYLSFGSFAGVLLLAPLIQQYFWGSSGEPGVLRGILVETSSAQLATMPIMLFSFGQYSAYALLANMIVLPLIPLTMLLTFIAGIAGIAVPGFAHWIGLPAQAILHYMVSAVQWIASLPGAQGDFSFNAATLAVSYLAMGLAIVYMWRRTGYRFHSERLIGEKA